MQFLPALHKHTTAASGHVLPVPVGENALVVLMRVLLGTVQLSAPFTSFDLSSDSYGLTADSQRQWAGAPAQTIAAQRVEEKSGKKWLTKPE